MPIDYTKRPAAQSAVPATDPATAQPSGSVSKVTLTKAAPTVSLNKHGGVRGTLHVNLNWDARPPARGLFKKSQQLDLDLGCLYEFSDGSKGVVQALGNAFTARNQSGRQLLNLDGDDRTGAVASGENLTINLDHKQSFLRILIFVTIYEGARSFADLHATVTLQPQNGAPIDFSLDECTVPSTVCALALITNNGGDLIVQREARYLVPERGVSPQRTVDRVYGWGMNWTPGRK
jgi:tellurite resistance protein TerA